MDKFTPEIVIRFTNLFAVGIITPVPFARQPCYTFADLPTYTGHDIIHLGHSSAERYPNGHNGANPKPIIFLLYHVAQEPFCA